MDKDRRKTLFTTVAIDGETNRLVEKICKRYSLKKGEIVKLAFQYIDKACINPAEAPESVKSELSKINKRQDDIIRFIRNYEEKELNPMIRASNSIAVRFDGITKGLEDVLKTEANTTREKYSAILQQINDQFNKHVDAVNTQAKQLSSLNQIQKRDNTKFLQLISLYADLAACGVMDGKRKENLKTEIYNLINSET